MSFRVLGTGFYVPPKIVTNDDLSKIVETSDEWITQRVGVRERHVCVTETAADLATRAAENALSDAGVKPEELDLILAATVSGETVSPSMACLVQRDIGATCPAYDINAACSAFIFLLETAAGFFARKKAKKILVIGTERMSRIVDWADRSTCVIFGDGAGAAVLGEGDGYLTSKFTVQGGDDVIKIPQYVGKSPFYEKEGEPPYVHMKGQETFKFAVNSICRDVLDVIADAGYTPEDVDYVVPHQANVRIIDFAAQRIGMPKDKFFVNIDRYGNTSSASIPIALTEMKEQGLLKRGQLIVLTAFGGGLASASCLIRW